MAADAASNGYCLDVLLFFGDLSDFPIEAGGYISYFAIEDSAEVIFTFIVSLFHCYLLFLVVASSAGFKLFGFDLP